MNGKSKFKLRGVLFILAAITVLAGKSLAAEGKWRGNGLPIYCQGQIACDGAGGAIINGDGVWSHINGDGEIQIMNCDLTAKRLIPDGDGGAILAWDDNRGGDYDIYCQRINRYGASQWQDDGVAVCANPGDQHCLELLPDGNGGAVVLWSEAGGNTYTSSVYCQRINEAGNSRWAVEGAAVCRNVECNQMKLKSIPDGTGGALIIWHDDYMGPGTIDINLPIYGQRIDGAGVRQWAENGLKICTAMEGNADLTDDGAGGAIIAWEWFKDFSYCMYCQKVSGSGVCQWAGGGKVICNAACGAENQLGIASDDHGGAIIVWEDQRNSDTTCAYRDVFSQRINGSGESQWKPNGIVIAYSNAASPQGEEQIIADGDGGAIIAWTDSRADTMCVNMDIYCQRVSGAGELQWTGNGMAICDEGSTQRCLKLIPDGAGGAIIVWDDFREGKGKCYCQRMIRPRPNVFHVNSPTVAGTVFRADISGEWFKDDRGSVVSAKLTRTASSDVSCVNDTLEIIDANYLTCDFNLEGITPGDWFLVLTDSLAQSSQSSVQLNITAPTPTAVITPTAVCTLADGGYATPNPFLPLRGQKVFFNFRFEAPPDTYIIRIYNLRGRLQRTLTGTREWDGRGDSGHLCEGGVYVYQIEADGRRVSGKVVLIR